jgi:hypothetical protein
VASFGGAGYPDKGVGVGGGIELLRSAVAIYGGGCTMCLTRWYLWLAGMQESSPNRLWCLTRVLAAKRSVDGAFACSFAQLARRVASFGGAGYPDKGVGVGGGIEVCALCWLSTADSCTMCLNCLHG